MSAIFTATSSGAGNFSVASGVSPASLGAITGNTYRYYALSADGSQWELGSGVWNVSTGTLSRTIIQSNTDATTTPCNFLTIPRVTVYPNSQNSLEVVPPRSFLSGLQMSTAGSSASFSVTAGQAADSTNVVMMTLPAAMTKSVLAWSVGSGNGGLDTGAIANNTWYHVHLIATAAGATDILYSLSATAPNLPSGYVYFRRLGSVRTNGSLQWILFSQNGDEFLWSVPTNDINTAGLGTTPTLYPLTVPPGLKVTARLRGYMTNGSTACNILINSPDEASCAQDVPFGNVTATANSANAIFEFTVDVRSDVNGNIRAVSGAASTTFVAVTYGWIDRRGRDA